MRGAGAHGRAVGTRGVVALGFLLVALGLVGCGVSPDSTERRSPSPAAQTTPPAKALRTVDSLFVAALYPGEAKGVRAEGLTIDPHPSAEYFAGASKGTFLVENADGTLALKDGTPATNVIAAVYPDKDALSKGMRFGPHMAAALGWPSIWQLKGAELGGVEHRQGAAAVASDRDRVRDVGDPRRLT